MPGARCARIRSHAGRCGRTTSASTSATAVSATPTCTRRATTGAAPCTRVSRPRDRRPGGGVGASVTRLHGRRLGGGGMPGRQLPGVQRVRRRARACSARGADADLQRQGPAHRRNHVSAATRRTSSSATIRAANAGRTRSRARRAVALRRHHDLLAAASLALSGPARRWPWPGLAVSVTWA